VQNVKIASIVFLFEEEKVVSERGGRGNNENVKGKDQRSEKMTIGGEK